MKKTLLIASIALQGTALHAQKLPGTSDSTFASNGFKNADFGQIASVAETGFLDNSGNLMVLGGSIDNNNDWNCGLTRFMPNGNVDYSFRGVGPSAVDFNPGTGDDISAHFLGKNNMVWTAGVYSGPNGADLMVAKFNQEGMVQNDFADAGLLTHEIYTGYEVPKAIIEDDQGRIIVLGNIPVGLGEMFLIRFTPDGKIDSSFDKDGIMYLDPLQGSNTPVALIERPKGGYYVVCSTTNNGKSYASVISVSNNGNYNIDLGGPGQVQLQVETFNTFPKEAVLFNGSLFISGEYTGAQNNKDGFVGRMEMDGKWNLGFGKDGVVSIQHSLANPYNEFTSQLAIAPDSSIFLGTVCATPNDTNTLIISRLQENGQVNGFFGNHNGHHYLTFSEGMGIAEIELKDMVLDTTSKRLYFVMQNMTPGSDQFSVFAAYTGNFKEKSIEPNSVQMTRTPLGLYPNPAKNQVFLDSDLSGSFKLVNLQGKTVQVGEAHGSFTLSPELENGIYIFLLNSGEGLRSARISINR